jgi:hypothetical protein
MNSSIKLTVFFEGEFWVGIFEKSYGNEYEVSRVVFVLEPKDFKVYEFILQNYYFLKFSTPTILEDNSIAEKKLNPKKYLRKIKKEVEISGIGTKAQLALKLQQEANKQKKQTLSKENKEAEEKRKFQLRQQKKSEKRKGH